MPLSVAEIGLNQMFGDVWEWAASPLVSCGEFKLAEGPLRESCEKFISGQMV